MKLKRTSNPTRQLVDDVFDGYVTWREQSLALAEAYERWKRAITRERDDAFDEYLSALDGEEAAASEYRRRIEAVGAQS